MTGAEQESVACPQVGGRSRSGGESTTAVPANEWRVHEVEAPPTTLRADGAAKDRRIAQLVRECDRYRAELLRIQAMFPDAYLARKIQAVLDGE